VKLAELTGTIPFIFEIFSIIVDIDNHSQL